MRRRPVLAAGLTAILAAACWFGIAAAGESAKKDAIRWKSDLKAAQKEAKKTGRPMLIVFGAEWCMHCGRFEQATLGDPKTASLINRDFVPVRLDFDEEQKTAEVMEVEALPCTVILSPDADLLGRVVGAKPPRELRDALQAAKNEHIRIRHARIAAAKDDGRN